MYGYRDLQALRDNSLKMQGLDPQADLLARNERFCAASRAGKWPS